MFSNIGETIKVLAKVAFWLAVTLCLIIGIASWIIEDKDFFMGMYPIVIGLFSSMGGSILIYGFGQLIVNTDIIAEHYGRQNEKHEKYVQKKKETEVKAHTQKAKVKIKDDNVDEEAFIDITCPHCKEMISFKKRTIVEEKIIECPFCENKIDFS